MPQAEEIRRPAQAAASWPEPWQGTTPSPAPPAWCYPPPPWYTPPPMEDPPVPDGTVSKLTYSVRERWEDRGEVWRGERNPKRIPSPRKEGYTGSSLLPQLFTKQRG